MAETPKVVFSNTLKEVKWNNSSLAQADPVTTVNRMKQEPGGDMVIFGGASLAAHFIKNNLIDEYRFKLEPVALGKGKSLFQGIPERMKLKLIKSKIFESGVAGLYYQAIRYFSNIPLALPSARHVDLRKVKTARTPILTVAFISKNFLLASNTETGENIHHLSISSNLILICCLPCRRMRNNSPKLSCTVGLTMVL
jgi:hypothetical protein